MKTFALAGWSGSGKNTLIEKLIPRFTARGLGIAFIKQRVKHPSPCDLLFVEGFKRAPIPKLEVWRAITGEGLLHPQDPHIVAVASDVQLETKLPLLALDDDAGIAAFILRHLAPA